MRLLFCAVFFVLGAAPAMSQTDTRCAVLAKILAGTTATSASGLRYAVLQSGAKRALNGNVAVMRYVVCLADGKLLDASPPGQSLGFTIGAKQVIPGTEEAVLLIGDGGEIAAYLPYALAYGERGRPPAVPPRSDLLFDIQLVGIQNAALSTVLSAAYRSGGVAKMRAAYLHASATGFRGLYAPEDDLNGLGYRFLSTHHADAAVAVLELNAHRFPGSANAYDSLGDAYRQAGNRALAIANYRRAVELNPQDENAANFLRALESGSP